MAFDDPIVWVLIVAVVVFLFGSSKIPSIARALGEARREFDKSFRGHPAGATTQTNMTPVSQNAVSYSATPTAMNSTFPTVDDPIVQAAQREGIDTTGKTREQIASELSWKLNKK